MLKLRKRKRFPCCFWSIETWMEVWGKREMLWEHKLLGECFHGLCEFFLNSQTLNSQHTIPLLMCPWVSCSDSCQAMPFWYWSAEKPGWWKRKGVESILLAEIAQVAAKKFLFSLGNAKQNLGNVLSKVEHLLSSLMLHQEEAVVACMKIAFIAVIY